MPRKQRCALSGHTLFIGLTRTSFTLAFYIPTSGIKFNVKKRLPKNTLPALAVGLFMVLLVLRPSYFLDSASRGLLLFATSVLPAVFPFFFCSSLLTALGGANALSRLGAKPVRALFNSPPVGAYVLTLSMLSGYPIGAATTADLYLRGAIDSDDAKRICSFTSTSGPIFILGTVGSAVFGSPVCGAIILAAHYAAAVTTGIVFRGRRKPSPPRTLPPPADHDGILAGCISSAALSMLAVGGYIVISNMLVDALSLAGLGKLLSSIPSREAAECLNAVIAGAVEMTRGSMAAADIPDQALAVALAAAIVSFGGLSVLLQSHVFLSRCGVRFSSLLARKAVQCAAAFIYAYTLSQIIFTNL